MFGCELTVFTGHPQIYSISRSRHVLPGSIMRMGYTNTHPTLDMAKYDTSLCPITG